MIGRVFLSYSIETSSNAVREIRARLDDEGLGSFIPNTSFIEQIFLTHQPSHAHASSLVHVHAYLAVATAPSPHPFSYIVVLNMTRLVLAALLLFFDIVVALNATQLDCEMRKIALGYAKYLQAWRPANDPVFRQVHDALQLDDICNHVYPA